MSAIRNPLLAVLGDPHQARCFSIGEWNLLLRQARRESLMARLGILLEDADLLSSCPETVVETTRAAKAYVDFHHVRIRCEIRRITHALAGIDTDLIFLKGAAYMAARLPLARGRRMSDIDILVPQDELAAVEERLLQRGWQHQMLDSYDQRYYREWMHEIPPLRHPEHGIELDIHHALLPLTARVRPDPALLWQASIPVDMAGLRVLAPADMVLHSAAHLFYDGEIAGGLRDLLDLHQMLGGFGREAGFWQGLPERAARLELTRPLFYALRYCHHLLGTQIPDEVLAAVEHLNAPRLPVRAAMDILIQSVLRPQLPDAREAAVSAWLLYVRSHWLRMPPWLLGQHLSRKAWRRLLDMRT